MNEKILPSLDGNQLYVSFSQIIEFPTKLLMVRAHLFSYVCTIYTAELGKGDINFSYSALHL